MGLISDDDKATLTGLFEALVGPVSMVLFTRRVGCKYCDMTATMLEEVAALDEALTLSRHDLDDEPDLAARYGIDKVPGLALVGQVDYGIRYFGIPAGYEFASLVEDLVDVSRGSPALDDDLLEILGAIVRPVHVEVFISPTCPYCPKVVRAAHRFAMACPHLRADMVEHAEFPALARRFGVDGVPKTIIDGQTSIDGMLTEIELARAILDASRA